MALATTTLTSAVALTDTKIVVASATSVAIGRLILIDQEMMQVTKGYVTAELTVPVTRGQNGTVTAAHVVTANVTHGDAGDFDVPPPFANVGYPTIRPTRIQSITATSTLALQNAGEDLRVILNGTSVITLTIPVPTKDMDGCRLSFVGNGAAAHVLTFTGGLSGAGGGYDTITVNATAPVATEVIACNGLWLAYANVPLAGTVTNVTATVA